VNKCLIYKIVAFFVFITILSCYTDKKNKENAVFRYNQYENITSLDPAFASNLGNIWAINQLFNGLVQLDDSLRIQPEIAKKWEVDNTGLVYTFTLRNDVFFHSSPLFKAKNKTRKVKADDFVYSFNRLKDPKVASPGGWVLEPIESYTAKNDSTFIIRLKRPFPAFLGLLTMRYFSVIPYEIANFHKNNFRVRPIGTGPFLFKRWEENEKLIFRKNTNYFEKDELGNSLPYLEAIAITFLPDIQNEFMLFLQGKLDFLNSLDSSYKDELLTPSGNLQTKYTNRINIKKGPYLNTEYLGFYMDSLSKEIQSYEIRKAINIGFNREKMISFLKNNIGFPAYQGIIPKGLEGHPEKKYFEYNPKKAEQLVAKFKQDNNNIAPKLTLATDINYLDISEFLQHELEKIGIIITINVLPSAILRQAKRNGNLELFRASWIADYPDAENYLSLFYSKNFTPNGPNYTHFKNRTFDSLYTKAMQINDRKKRIALYKQLDSIIIKELPIIPLYYDQAIHFTQKNVVGLNINPINLLNLKRVKKNNTK